MKRRLTTLGKKLNQEALAKLGKIVFVVRNSPEEVLEYWGTRKLSVIIDESLYNIDYTYGRRGGWGDNSIYEIVDNLIAELKTS